MKILNQIVKDMLEKHKGGEKFFDNLDTAIQDTIIIDELIKRIRSIFPSIFPNLIVSGRFGIFFVNYYLGRYYACGETLLLVNGGLRKGNAITNLSYRKDDIEGQDFIFIDDSFYSGKTSNAVKNEIERNGGRLIKTLVVYDGSIEKDKTVESLYRYYDHTRK